MGEVAFLRFEVQCCCIAEAKTCVSVDRVACLRATRFLVTEIKTGDDGLFPKLGAWAMRFLGVKSAVGGVKTPVSLALRAWALRVSIDGN